MKAGQCNKAIPEMQKRLYRDSDGTFVNVPPTPLVASVPPVPPATITLLCEGVTTVVELVPPVTITWLLPPTPLPVSAPPGTVPVPPVTIT
jgi:hypothetical protein